MRPAWYVPLFKLGIAVWMLVTGVPAMAEGRLVRVGLYENAPKVFTDASGKPAGIFVDILNEIAHREGWRLSYVPGSWSEGLQRLEGGQIDLMPDVAFNAERGRVFGFHKVPVLASWFQVYVRPGSDIRTVLDLRGRRIAVLKDSVQESAFQHLTGSFGVETSLLSAPDYQSVFERVISGQADAAIVNHFYGARHAADMGLEDTAIIFSPSDLFYATRQGSNQELLNAIDQHLASMKQEQGSDYYHSLSRWLSDDTDAEVPAWLRVSAQMLGLLLVLSLVGSLLLRRQVRLKTRHLQQMNRALATLSAASAQAATARDEMDLLERVCRVAVDVGGYELAWVAHRSGPPEHRIQAVALAVQRGSNWERLEPCWCDSGWGTVPVAAAFQSGRPVAHGDLVEEGSLSAFRSEIEQSGLLSALSIPIASQGHTFGVLSVLSARARAFAPEEVTVFTDLANDLAVGIGGLRAGRLRTESEEQRKAAEDALRDNERKYRTLFESSNDAILLMTGQQFIDCNPKSLEIFGCTRKALVGAAPHQFSPELQPDGTPSQQAAQQRIEDAMDRGPQFFQWRHCRLDKSEFDAEVSLNRVDLGGQTLLHAQVRDITRRREAEQEVSRLNESLRTHALELEQRVAQRTAELAISRDRAEESDRLKSAFLATMSHELRTPLNSIIGFSGILLQELAGPLNDEQKKQMGMVCSASEHLLALINDVLDLSKIEAGELQLVPEPFDLEAALYRLVAVTQPLALRKGIGLDIEVGPDLTEVVGDRRRIEQVVLNLLSNGIKFTETGRVKVEAQRIGSACRVEVTDTGIGIREADLGTLFKPFRQVDSGLARRHEGTGLGLSICKRLVELMGGEIGAHSEWGVGSTFHLEIPLKGG